MYSAGVYRRRCGRGEKKEREYMSKFISVEEGTIILCPDNNVLIMEVVPTSPFNLAVFVDLTPDQVRELIAALQDSLTDIEEYEY